MTKTEKEILQGIDPRMKEQAAMVWKIEKVFRKKVKAVLPMFDELPVAQAVTTTQGEQVLKGNPAMQEIRAMIKDYVFITKTQWDMLGDVAPTAEISQLDSIRQRWKIAK